MSQEEILRNFKHHIIEHKANEQSFAIFASDEHNTICANFHFSRKEHAKFAIRAIAQYNNLTPQEVMYEMYKEIMES